jgi:hypothetical protein
MDWRVFAYYLCKTEKIVMDLEEVEEEEEEQEDSYFTRC